MSRAYNYCTECGRRLKDQEYTICTECEEDIETANFDDDFGENDEDFKDGDNPFIFYKE